MDKKISVIIPVYNVEPDYIDTAINSVLEQTYENIEIIVVNDGSTNEETLKYLNSINNCKIKIVNQENKGLGGARNTGIENSTGEYVGFLDSDDWLDNNYYEVLYNLCETNNADIACGTLTRVGKDYETPMDYFENNVVSKFIEKIKYITNGSTCSKLFKKELLSEIKFMEHMYFEDNPFLVKILSKSNKVAFTNKVKYYYRENPKSIIMDPLKKDKREKDGLYVLEDICSTIKDKTKKEKEEVLYIFSPILVYLEECKLRPDYEKKVISVLGKKYKKYMFPKKNTFIENIFSIKDTKDKKRKIITILGLKFKIKRKSKNA